MIARFSQLDDCAAHEAFLIPPFDNELLEFGLLVIGSASMMKCLVTQKRLAANTSSLSARVGIAFGIRGCCLRVFDILRWVQES